MRIAVIGAGAVGGALAALLDRAGHDVEVTARGAHLAAIREHGLRLDGGWGEHVARVTANETLSRGADLVLLTTKAQDAAAALRANAAMIGSAAPVVVVQNGLGGLAVARAALPGSPILGGLALFAASYLSPGRITITAAQPIVVGAGPGVDPTLLERVAQVLRGALPVEVTPDLAGAQWTKLVINHVNALPAITGLSVQEVVADPRLRRIMAASIRETVRLAGRLGVRFADLQDVRGALLPWLGRAPLGIVALLPRHLARGMGAVPNPGSTLQSLRRGQKTEIDFLNGAVVAAAREMGLVAPVNAALVELVHEVERTGVHLAQAEVVARVTRSASAGS